ncbi:hypothetical protein KIN20_020991 [Parelaphostrongylus tenuis]|uniref:Uncharacterized protein n=1 Tax=Parelaphostrongylus tenuis TaxID=148309 RepID=A0AAD5MNC2_PARTN|nr:hypothetical protein KIN20_020991 [Parelaphostrongylus tenuis]
MAEIGTSSQYNIHVHSEAVMIFCNSSLHLFQQFFDMPTKLRSPMLFLQRLMLEQFDESE